MYKYPGLSFSSIFICHAEKFKKHGDALHRRANTVLIAFDYNYPAYPFF